MAVPAADVTRGTGDADPSAAVVVADANGRNAHLAVLDAWDPDWQPLR